MAVEAGQQESSDRLKRVSEGVSGMASLFEQKEEKSDEMEILADEVAAWMGVGGLVVRGPKVLPAGDE